MSVKRPNILLFLADDLGWKDTGAYGSGYFETPCIDGLALQGMRFTNAYSANPLCSPTRASILTGKNPDRLNITCPHCHEPPRVASIAGRGESWERVVLPLPQTFLPTTEYTLPKALRDGGYRTVHVGKWHLGQFPYFPENHGYEVNIGGQSWGGPRSYFPPYENDRLADGPAGEYLTDRLAREAVAAMDAAGDDRPFFMALWTYAVHSPFQAKPEYIARYEGKVDPNGIQSCPTMGAMVQSMDDSVGVILEGLRAKGLEDSTIVIFMSDNGPSKGKVKGVPVSSAAPLRGMKGSLYEGGIRVPLIVRWPGVTEAGSVRSEIVTSTDLYATILAMAGLDQQPRQSPDSTSFVPLLRGSRGPGGRDTYVCHYPQGAAYVKDKDGKIAAGSAHHVAGTTLRLGDWKLIRRWDTNEHFPHAHELYNLADDEGEATNLAGRHPGKVRELEALIDEYLAATGALVPAANPAYDPASRRGLEPAATPGVFTSLEA